MSFDRYTGPSAHDSEHEDSDSNAELPASDDNPANYMPSQELQDAVNVALSLGFPLLLTGEAGTGKTQLANSVAFRLGCAEPIKFVAKSTSESRDLFYRYDALGRFASAQLAEYVTAEREKIQNPARFIEYVGLGKAILLAHEVKEIQEFLSHPSADSNDTERNGISHMGKRCQSVVLIDEIDKAPRDFTNDLLDELDHLRFRVPELQNIETPAIEAAEYKPIVIITSNSERLLPDPFLRRCIYCHIPFPDRRPPGADVPGVFIEDIVSARLGSGFSHSPLVNSALDFFYKLREHRPALRKRPATAELLSWLLAMRLAGANPDADLVENKDYALKMIGSLLKTEGDQTLGRGLITNN